MGIPDYSIQPLLRSWCLLSPWCELSAPLTVVYKQLFIAHKLIQKIVHDVMIIGFMFNTLFKNSFIAFARIRFISIGHQVITTPCQMR